MKMTNVEQNKGHTSMKAMAWALFPSLSWRHHGIGVLQGYICEGVQPEVRIHVWAPELMKPGMSESGDIHDHRFDMVSHVLVGAVAHEEILPCKELSGHWSMLKLTHARAAKEANYHGPTETLLGRYSITRSHMRIPEGYSYTFPRARFHRSPILGDVAVTCVEKHNQSSESARILHPADIPPIMAFGHDLDWTLAGPVLRRARKALEGKS